MNDWKTKFAFGQILTKAFVLRILFKAEIAVIITNLEI
jgi:hypothetical protein